MIQCDTENLQGVSSATFNRNLLKPAGTLEAKAAPQVFWDLHTFLTELSLIKCQATHANKLTTEVTRCRVACGMGHACAAAVKLHAGNHNLSSFFSSPLSFASSSLPSADWLTWHIIKSHKLWLQLLAAFLAPLPHFFRGGCCPGEGRGVKHKRIFRQFISWESFFSLRSSSYSSIRDFLCVLCRLRLTLCVVPGDVLALSTALGRPISRQLLESISFLEVLKTCPQLAELFK